jgi:hypothetical protein
MSDLPADLLDIVEHLDGSQKSLDVLGGLLFRTMARLNGLDKRVMALDKFVERVTLLDEITSKLARRVRQIEAQPAAIGPDEQIKETPLPPMRRNRRGRPKGALNRKTILKQRMAELSANRLGSAA